MRLLDVFHTVVGKRTPQCHHDDYFARTRWRIQATAICSRMYQA
jgi:hypothetical protein